MANELMHGAWPRGYKYHEWQLGQRGDRLGLEVGWAGWPRPTSAQPTASFAWCRFSCLLPSACGPCRQFLFGLDEAPYLTRFNSFLTGSLEFSMFSGLVLGLLGVMFTSLLDLYRASRSCHEVLNELILEVLLSILKFYINTKLQNQHAQMNLLYQGG
jgi:hypothetical protein